MGEPLAADRAGRADVSLAGWWDLRGASGWGAIVLLGLACTVLGGAYPWLRAVPDALALPLIPGVESAMVALTDALKPVSRVVGEALEWPMVGLAHALQWVPWPVTVMVVGWIAWRSGGGAVLVTVCVLALLYVALSGYWRQAMNTMALVGIAVPLSVATGLAVGVAAVRDRRVERVVSWALDLMQTVPTFAYLIPLLVMFGFGPVVGLIASAIYACPPMVRNVMLGLRQVPSEIVEAAKMSGTSRMQRLFWAEIPAAAAQIKVGLNQTIMAALSMVIIASVIGGFDDIGWEVLSSMRKARFGESLLAGLVIVLIAVILDRVSMSFAAHGKEGGAAAVSSTPARTAAMLAAAAVGVVVLKWSDPAWVAGSEEWGENVARAINDGLSGIVTDWGDQLTWLKNQMFFYYLLPLRVGLDQAILPLTWGIEFTPGLRAGYGLLALGCVALLFARRGWASALVAAVAGYYLYFGLTGSHWPVTVALLTFLGWRLGGIRLAGGIAAALGLIIAAGLWDRAMLSLYLCLAAALMAFALGSALGIWAASSGRASRVIRVVCDTFQTIPLFVFLIPTLMLFQIGEFTALLAIIAYAFVPAVRYTESGLRQVPKELVEAAAMQGCTRRQMFWDVRLPVAVPSMLVGLNQTIMYSFAMLVIAALVGTTGLGQQIYVALAAADMGLGLSAGLAMAFLAMIIDRLLQAWANERYSFLG